MKKRVICLLTNWYPTLDNPIKGVFFREQALALKEYFDFLVVHYKINYGIGRRKYSAFLLKEEENIKEYQLELPFLTLPGRIKNRLFPHSVDIEEEIGKRLINAFKKGIKDSFDVLYCVSGQMESAYLKMIADAYQKPYIVSEHGPVPWLGTVVSEANKKGIENANLLMLISYDKLRQIMMQDIKIPPFVYVGNMVDENLFTYKEVFNNEKTFVMVGAHVFYKNHQMLIKIMNRLKHLTECPFKVMLVGYAANKGYSKNVEELESAIEKSDFSDCVELIPFVDHNKMPEIYNRADAFVMTSVQEGMPVSALEAGCCGLPIFATRCGGVEDYVTERIGRIYDIWDVDSFAQGLCDFIEGRIIFESEYIRKSIVDQFGRHSFTQNMVNAFNRVINARLDT